MSPKLLRRNLITARGAHIKRSRVIDNMDSPTLRALPGESGRGQRNATRELGSLIGWISIVVKNHRKSVFLMKREGHART